MSTILLASLFSGCTQKQSSENALFKSPKVLAATKDSDESAQELRLAYSEFVFGVMKNCAEKDGNTNILVSPDSILFAMEMAAAGADGDTLDQMIGTMVPGSSNEAGLAFGVNHMKELQNDSLIVANSMWLKKGSRIYEDYVKFVEDNFDAEANEIELDKEAVDKINDWVDDQTDGMIPEIINSLDPNTKLVLVNAIAFEGTWKKPVSERSVNPGTFTNGDGSESECPFMNFVENTYVMNDECLGIIKSYADDNYAFMAILPKDETVDVNEFMAQMTAEDYWELWNGQIKKTVMVSLPEFTSGYEVRMNETLADMGMTDAFTSNANFGNMCDTDLYINEVIHKTCISVDHEGTEAAAVTSVGSATQSAIIIDEKLDFNRPFAYAIVDTDTGLPVFLGTVKTI